MQGNEIHIMRVNITIRKVVLMVRFPCSLSFQLKADDKAIQIQNKHTYQIKNGQCTVNELLSLETEFEFNPTRKRYQDRNISLVVMLNSANGKIPAGTAISVIKHQEHRAPVQLSLPLEKCPDKAAKAYFLQTIEFVQKRQGLTADSNGTSNVNSNNSNSGVGLRKNMRQSSVTSLNYKNYPRERSSRIVTQDHQTTQKDQSEFRQYKSKEGRLGLQGSRLRQSNVTKTDSERSYHSKTLLSNQEEQLTSQQHQKILRLQKEKTQYIRELAKLKGELQTMHLEVENRQSQDALELMNELDTVKEQLRTSQRNQKELASTIRQLKQQLENIKNRVQYSQSQKSEMTHNRQKHERSIKQLQTIKKQHQQKLQDMNMEVSALQKRIQFKESSYKNQIKKMTEKYTQGEEERKKSMQDYNNLLSEMETNQRRAQTTIKQKERQFAQERSKLTKKIEQMTKTIATLEQDLTDKDNAMKQISEFGKQNELEQEQKIIELNSLRLELEQVKELLREETQKRNELQQQIESMRTLEGQVSQNKKKYSEVISQLGRVKQKLQKTQANCLQLEGRAQQYQQISKQKSSLEKKLTLLNKDLQTLRKNEGMKQQQTETLSVQNYSAGQKITELKNRLAQQRTKYTQLETEYRNQMSYMITQKEQLLAEMQDMRWALEKSGETEKEIIEKMRQTNEERLATHSQNLQFSEKIAQLNEALNESKLDIESMMTHQQVLEERDRESQRLLKEKTDIIQQHKRKIDNLQQSSFTLRQKVDQYDAFYNDKLDSEEAIIKQKESIIVSKAEEITQLQLQLMNKNETILLKEQQIKIKANQIQRSKEQLNAVRMSLVEQEEVSAGLRTQVLETSDQLSRTSSDLKTKTYELATLERSISRTKTQWEEYKTQVEKAMQQILKEMSKDDDEGNIIVNSLPLSDVNLSMLWVEGLKRRNEIISSYRLKSTVLEQTVRDLETALSKQKTYLEERQLQYENDVRRLKSSSSETLSELFSEKHRLFEQVKSHEEKIVQITSQSQKLNHELHTLNQHLSESKIENTKLSHERDSLNNQIKNIEEELAKTRGEFAQRGALQSNQLNQVLLKSAAQQQRLKNLLTDTEKKLINNEKTLTQRQDTIRALQQSFSQLTRQKQNLMATVQQQAITINNLEQSKKQSHQHIQVLQKHDSQLMANIQEMQTLLLQEQIHYKQLQTRYDAIQREYHQLQVVYDRNQKQTIQMQSTIEQLEHHLRSKGQKVKHYGQRSSEQVKSLQEKLIQLKSELDLKLFVIQQNENLIQRLNRDKADLELDVNKRKAQLLKTENTIQQLKCELLFRGQSEESLASERHALMEEIDQSRAKILELENQVYTLNGTIQILQMKQKQLVKLKERLEKAEQQVDRQASDLRVSTVENRKELVSRSNKEQELRRKVRELEKVLEERELDLQVDRKKRNVEFDREKKDLQSKVANLQQYNKSLQEQVQSQKEQLQDQIETLSNQCLNLQGVIAEKQELLIAQDSQIQQYELKIEGLTTQLKNCLEVWDKQKSTYLTSKKRMVDLQNEMGKFQKYATELDCRSRQLLEVSKKRVSEEEVAGVADILRDVQIAVMKTKTKALGRAKTEQEKQNVLSDYKNIQQKIDLAAKTPRY